MKLIASKREKILVGTILFLIIVIVLFNWDEHISQLRIRNDFQSESNDHTGAENESLIENSDFKSVEKQNNLSEDRTKVADPENALRNFLTAKDPAAMYQFTLKKAPREDFLAYYRDKFQNVISVDNLETVAQNSDSSIIIASYKMLKNNEQERSMIRVFLVSRVNNDWKVDWEGQIFKKYLASRDKNTYSPLSYYALLDLTTYYNCTSERAFYGFVDERGNQVNPWAFDYFYIYGRRSLTTFAELNKYLSTSPKVVKISLYNPESSSCPTSIQQQMWVLGGWISAKESLSQKTK